MNGHKNARTTFAGRKLLIESIGTVGLMPAAEAAGVSRHGERKWLQRFHRDGESGRSPHSPDFVSDTEQGGEMTVRMRMALLSHSERTPGSSRFFLLL